MPAGLLNELSQAFDKDVATVGMLIAYGAALLCVEAPLFAFLTNKVDRRKLLTGSLLVYMAGHLASAFAASFSVLLIARLLMIGGAAIFTPQAASAIGLFVSPERRSNAVAFIFLGWSFASAVGIPLANLIGAYTGWSSAYLVLGVASGIAALAVHITVQKDLHAPRLSPAAWRKVLSSKSILTVLSVTLVFIAGQFTVYPYIAAELKTRLSATPGTISIVFAVYGLAGVVGSMISAVAIGRLGAAKTVNISLAIVAAGLAVWGNHAGSMLLAVAGLIVWGYGGGPAISGQQARLIAADPAVASASVALNTSVLYAGQAIGTYIGGRLLAEGRDDSMGIVAVAFILVAMGISLTVYRKAHA
jgi:MFS transporter, DHA1 family, inner membrane transport protein